MSIRFAWKAAACTAAVMGLATSAWAQNDGHMNGVWMMVDMKAKLNLVDYSGPGPYTTVEKVKLRTPEDACYVVPLWNGPDSYSYDICEICQDASGDWDYSYANDMYEVEEGALANDWQEICILAEGDDFSDPVDFCQEGFLRIEPKMSDGVVKKVKLLANKGKKTMAWRGDEAADTFGTGEAKLKLKVVPEADVPAAAQDEFVACEED